MKQVKVMDNASYKRYADLIKKRDELRKAAFHYDYAYTNEFGDLILEVFEKKIECIRKKKMISYCQMMKNRGQFVNQEELQEYLQIEMASFYLHLEYLVERNKVAKSSTAVPEKDIIEIKRIYRRIAKLIHPDMNSAVREDEKLLDIWSRVVVAYKCNSLNELRELEALLREEICKNGVFPPGIIIPNILERLKELENEIETIKETDPYLYKFLLEDPSLVEEKKSELKEELEEYEEYSRSLETALIEALGKGMTFVWKMD